MNKQVDLKGAPQAKARGTGDKTASGAISGNLSPTSEGPFSFPHQGFASGLIVPARVLG